MSSPTQAQLDATAVENFREYLRIPSVHPNVNYGKLSHRKRPRYNNKILKIPGIPAEMRIKFKLKIADV